MVDDPRLKVFRRKLKNDGDLSRNFWIQSFVQTEEADLMSGRMPALRSCLCTEIPYFPLLIILIS